MNKIEIAKDIMKYINKDFVKDNNMFLIGGTTISLLNHEYRRSDDLDFYYEDKNDVDFYDFLLDNEIYKIKNTENDYYTTKIFIVKKDDPDFKPYKIEMVKFEKNTVELINKILDFQEYNEFKALSDENLLYLKLASFFNRHNKFPFKDFFDLFILHDNLGKEFKNLNNITYYLKHATSDNIETFGTIFLNLTKRLITERNLLEDAKTDLKIKIKNINKEKIMEFLVQYIEFEKEFYPSIDRKDFIEKLDIILTENNINVLANQKRRLNLKPNLDEILEEEINDHKIYQANYRNRKKT